MKLEFQGFDEESPEAIHRFKLALIADLNVDVEHAQKLLHGETTTIIENDSLDLLERAQTRLLAIGVNVAIVGDVDDPYDSLIRDLAVESPGETELSVASPENLPPPAEPAANAPAGPAEEEAPLFSFEIDASDLIDAPAKPAEAPPKSYSVDLDDDLEQVALALGFSPEPEVPEKKPAELLPPPEETEPLFRFDAQDDPPPTPDAPIPGSDADFALGPDPIETVRPERAPESAPLFSFDDLNIEPAAAPTPPPPPSTPPTDTALEASFPFTTDDDAPPAAPAKTAPEPTPAPKAPPQSAAPQQLKTVAPSSPPPAAVAPAPPPAPNEEAAEETDEASSRPAPIVTSTRRGASDAGFSRAQLAALFLLGVGMLGSINWFLARSAPEPVAITPIAVETEDPVAQKASPSPRAASLPSFSGVARDKTVGLSVNLALLPDGSVRAKVEGRGDNRPTYSPAEIASNLDKEPWITRVDADPFVLQKVGDKQWSGAGTAFLYIDALERRFRAATPIRITFGMTDDATGTADVELTLTPDGDPRLPTPDKLIESVPGERFRAYLRVSVSVSKPTPAK